MRPVLFTFAILAGFITLLQGTTYASTASSAAAEDTCTRLRCAVADGIVSFQQLTDAIAELAAENDVIHIQLAPNTSKLMTKRKPGFILEVPEFGRPADGPPLTITADMSFLSIPDVKIIDDSKLVSIECDDGEKPGDWPVVLVQNPRVRLYGLRLAKCAGPDPLIVFSSALKDVTAAVTEFAEFGYSVVEQTNSSTGAIVVQYAALQIHHFKTRDNYGGPTIGTTHSNLQLDQVVMEDTGGAEDAQGVIQALSSIVTISNSTFRNNRGMLGAVISTEVSALSIRDSEFFNNTASQGGAINTWQTNITLERVNMIGNTAELQQGGAVFSECPDAQIFMVVRNSTFENNTAPGLRGQGGAIALLSGGSLTIAGSKFRSNNAGLTGGAILRVSGSTSIADCMFDNNEADTGGAILFDQASVAAVESTTFAGNAASIGGAAVVAGAAVDPTVVNITSSIITGHVASIAGAMFLVNARANMERVQLSGNTAGVDCAQSKARSLSYQGSLWSVGNGGALMTVNSDTTMSNSSVWNNTACLDGGGMYSMQSSFNIHASPFTSNKAGGSGGGIACSAIASSSTIANATWQGNAAGAGGGLAVAGNAAGQLTLQGLLLLGHKATSGDGGAVLVDAPVDLTLHACNFSGNAAAGSGGGVACKRCGRMESTACSFADGTAGAAGGGLQCAGCGSLRVSGSSFHNCSAAAGGGVHAEAGHISIHQARLTSCRAAAGGTAALPALPSCDAAGAGGAACLRPSQSATIAGVTAKDNSATYGGAIFADIPAASAISINTTSFSNNTASKGAGGAVYTTNSSATSIDGAASPAADTSQWHAANSATDGAYGPGIASHGNLLTCLEQVVVASPSGAIPNISLQFRDSYRSVATSFGPSTGLLIRATLQANTSTTDTQQLLDGQTAVPAANGAAQFENNKVLAPPGSLFQLLLQADAVATSIQLPLLVAPCYLGSIAQGGTCEVCPGSTYTLSASGACMPCPDNAECSSGVAVAASGFWNAHPLLPAMLECPSPKACVHSGRELAGIAKHASNMVNSSAVAAAYADAICSSAREGALCMRCQTGKAERFGHCTDCVATRGSSVVAFVLARAWDVVATGLFVGAVYWAYAMQQQHKEEEEVAGNWAALRLGILVLRDFWQLVALWMSSAAKYVLPLPLLSTMSALLPTPQSTMEWLPAACMLLAPGANHLPASILQSYLSLLLPLLLLLLLVPVLWLRNRSQLPPKPAAGALAAVFSWYHTLWCHAVLSTYSCTRLPVMPSVGSSTTALLWTVDPDVRCYEGPHARLTAFVSVLLLPPLACYLAAHLWVLLRAVLAWQAQGAAAGADEQSTGSYNVADDWVCSVLWMSSGDGSEVGSRCMWWHSAVEFVKLGMVAVAVFNRTQPAAGAAFGLAVFATAAGVAGAVARPYSRSLLDRSASSMFLAVALLAILSLYDSQSSVGLAYEWLPAWPAVAVAFVVAMLAAWVVLARALAAVVGRKPREQE